MSARFGRLIAVASFLVAISCGSDPEQSTSESGGSGGASGGQAGSSSAGASASGGIGASGGGGSAGRAGSAGQAGSGAQGGSGGASPGLSGDYPGDVGIESDPDVIFHSNFESDMAGWTSFTQNAQRLRVIDDATSANGGSKYLEANVTRTMLASQQYISAQARFEFPAREEQMYWRFYTRYVGDTAVPHHWVRVAAGNDAFNSDGLAAVVPGGNEGFWFDLDAKDNGFFSFYVYWHEMRSWECNDGSTDPNCAGYNGPSSTPYYGNNFNPADQAPFPRDQWFCVEVLAKANTPGSYDGELALYVEDQLVGEYRTGTPRGRWLRDNFYSHGQYFQDQQGFEGFNFRTSADVGLKAVTLDAYYEKGTLDAKEQNGITVPEAQVTHYDDVVVARRRIGCKH
ncbi:MAG: hypothetical protein H6718_17825 [Polyangiaceae bacterium]|nr:hypothetical protein [Polyangiaceae bacterium]